MLPTRHYRQSRELQTLQSQTSTGSQDHCQAVEGDLMEEVDHYPPAVLIHTRLDQVSKAARWEVEEGIHQVNPVCMTTVVGVSAVVHQPHTRETTVEDISAT